MLGGLLLVLCEPAPTTVTAEEKSTQNPPAEDIDLSRIVSEEQDCLSRIHSHLDRRKLRPPSQPEVDYDSQMLALRDEIAAARTEDVPPLLEQMERLQSLATRRREKSQGFIDPRSPYFGHLSLEENGKRREVLIGRATYLDTTAGVRIVDWRDAPVSRLYYRYDEGEEYDEVFGDREVCGEVKVRRSVTIKDKALRRIGAPQGTFELDSEGNWRRLEVHATRLHGGQGSAIRAERHHRPGKLGTGNRSTGSDDTHLQEITPLIDRRQFELITQPDSGLVVIQGGAGSGKTTIGLHRLAYLAYNDRRRFRPDRMLVVVFNEALSRYISHVLPALGVEGVAIRTYEDWAGRLRAIHYPHLPRRYNDDTPSVVIRLKKHPAMLKLIAAYANELCENYYQRFSDQLSEDQRPLAERAFSATAGRPVVHRLHALERWLNERTRQQDTNSRVRSARILSDGLSQARDVVSAWADLLGDLGRLRAGLERYAPGAFSDNELTRAHAWCESCATRALTEMEELRESLQDGRPARRAPRGRPSTTGEDGAEFNRGVDGRAVEEGARLDREDDSLLLRLTQELRGPLRRHANGKEALVYEHVLVDEAQDLSPLELDVIMHTVSKARSVTLAGDVAQKLLMDNGFSDWQTVLSELGLAHVQVEPLRISYRSTEPIIEFAQQVLGPLSTEQAPIATRGGAPVELFEFEHTGASVAMLAEALRELTRTEPRASVALITRYSEQADLYYESLKTSEVYQLRRITEQDFPFKPGIDVTDVRQVKGLEFDYVLLVEVSESSYPDDDEARHLLHIAATRAAHQLWVLTAGRPSPLLPPGLLSRSHY